MLSSREPLTEKERRQIRWAYFKGTEARKRVIQRLFGRHITYASCMSMVDKYVREAELKGKAKAVAKPTEEELWDWLCCATFHGHVWSPDFGGNIRSWIEGHCQAVGDVIWEIHKPELLARQGTVPDPIDATLGIRAYQFFTIAFRQTTKLIGPILIFILGYFFERIADRLFP